MIGTFGDSTRVTLKPEGMRALCFAAMIAAVSQPAVPPPTITILFTGFAMNYRKQKKAGDVNQVDIPGRGRL
jgi:hypothetical protein